MMRFEGYQPQSEWGKRLYREGERKGRLEGEREGRLEGERKGRREGKREGRLEGERKGRREGKLEGETTALNMLLQARGLSPNEQQCQAIARCNDLTMLGEWLRRAATATSLTEVFDP